MNYDLITKIKRTVEYVIYIYYSATKQFTSYVIKMCLNSNQGPYSNMDKTSCFILTVKSVAPV